MKGLTETRFEAATNVPELMSLRRVSTQLGNNPMLVQASNGNTSIKLDGDLWIKASGRWLANAMREDSMIPLDLQEVREMVRTGKDISGINSASDLRPSIETPMHAILPHRVVIHVHSVNTIAWAIRRSAEISLKVPLAGLRWRWIPYVASGIPLAREIEKRIADAPKTEIFILGNHGLVVCAEDCDSAEALLCEVERRLAISPRPVLKPDMAPLKEIADSAQLRIPDDPSLHGLGIDSTSISILRGGTLFPCQAMFLGEQLSVFQPAEIVRRVCCEQSGEAFPSWFVVAEGAGVLLRRRPSRSELATLSALAEVLQRTSSPSDVRYLDKEELLNLMNTNAEAYKTSGEES